MEIMIELTEDDLSQIAGGQAGRALVTFSQSAAGPFATLTANVNIATTATSASLSGSFSSESDTV
jgi:bacteriocin-like protein